MNTNKRHTSGIETEYDRQYGPKQAHHSKGRQQPARGPDQFKGGDLVTVFTEDDTDDLGLDDALDEAAKNELCSFIFKNIVGYDFVFRGPFGRNVVTYLDYVASGRPLKCIETYIRYNVMPTYANTHTEVNYFATQTGIMREEARSIIKKCVNAGDDDALVFCGTGSTTAIHKLIHAMDIKKATVLIGPFEHHSNILPWKEINAKVVRIRQSRNGTIDMDHLNDELQKCDQRLFKSGERMLIGSFSAASNVTGILMDTETVCAAIHRHNGFVFFDYACSGPYVNIDMNPADKKNCYIDAIFISTHKFVGGPQTPGILVAKQWMFRNRVPHGVGGGTVAFVTRKTHHYHKQVEHREEGGTPGIVESIRAGLVFKLKNAFGASFIMEREAALFRLAAEAWGVNPHIVILGSLTAERLPIFPLLFFNEQTGRFIHHDFIALILNDVFGIQVRSGCACAAPYGMDLLGINDKVMRRFEDLIIQDHREKDQGYTDGDLREEAPYGTEDNVETKRSDMGPSGNSKRLSTNGNANTNKPVETSPTIGDPNINESAKMSPPLDNANTDIPVDLSPTNENANTNKPVEAQQIPVSNSRNLVFKPGFVRLNFPFFISEECFDFVIRAIQLVADKGWSLMPLYTFNRHTGAWDFAEPSKKFHRKKSLKDITFVHGRFDLKKHPKMASKTKIGEKVLHERVSPCGSLASVADPHPGFNYQEIIDRAEQIFEETMTPGKFPCRDDCAEYVGEAEKLRWFMLPCEAANIINKKKEIKKCTAEEMPLKPNIIPVYEEEKDWPRCSCCAVIFYKTIRIFLGVAAIVLISTAVTLAVCRHDLFEMKAVTNTAAQVDKTMTIGYSVTTTSPHNATKTILNNVSDIDNI